MLIYGALFLFSIRSSVQAMAIWVIYDFWTGGEIIHLLHENEKFVSI